MITQCVICGGKLRKTRQDFHYAWKGKRVVVIEEVPTYVCRKCGEGYFEPDVSRALDEIAQPLIIQAPTDAPHPLARVKFSAAPTKRKKAVVV
jgi:YgiT-type zinc finger domain-containing protein